MTSRGFEPTPVMTRNIMFTSSRRVELQSKIHFLLYQILKDNLLLDRIAIAILFYTHSLVVHNTFDYYGVFNQHNYSSKGLSTLVHNTFDSYGVFNQQNYSSKDPSIFVHNTFDCYGVFNQQNYSSKGPSMFVQSNTFLRPWVYFADSVEQDQPAHTCSLILPCTLRCSIISFCERKRYLNI